MTFQIEVVLMKIYSFSSVVEVIHLSENECFASEFVWFLHAECYVEIQHAISQGATPVADPEDKKWAQKVCYVKDINGNRVRLGSFVAMAS